MELQNVALAMDENMTQKCAYQWQKLCLFLHKCDCKKALQSQQLGDPGVEVSYGFIGWTKFQMSPVL